MQDHTQYLPSFWKPQTKPFDKATLTQPSLSSMMIGLNRTPGPGYYDVDNPHLRYNVFEKPPAPVLRLRSDHKPRSKIDLRTCKISDRIKDLDSGPPVTTYDLSNDPRKVSKAITMAQKLPLLNNNKKDLSLPGVGRYDTDEPLGQKRLLTPNKPKATHLIEIPESIEPKNITTKFNKRVLANYKSEYSFKKRPPLGTHRYVRSITK